jgi:hypothetical protein
VSVGTAERVRQRARALPGERGADTLDLGLQGAGIDGGRRLGRSVARCLRWRWHPRSGYPGWRQCLYPSGRPMQESTKTLGTIGGAGVGAAAQLYVEVSARYRPATAACRRS